MTPHNALVARGAMQLSSLPTCSDDEGPTRVAAPILTVVGGAP
jgi:hypothetical protein